MGLICSAFYFPGTCFQVPPQESKASVYFQTNSPNVVSPADVLIEGDTKAFDTSHRDQCVTMQYELVRQGYQIYLVVPHDQLNA